MADHRFMIGDYVLVTHPEIPSSEGYKGVTFRVIGSEESTEGRPLINVIKIENGRPTGMGTVFFPEELTHKYGTGS